MGKGDVRTRKGKIYNGSYGNKRPHGAKTAKVGATTATAKTASKKK